MKLLEQVNTFKMHLKLLPVLLLSFGVQAQEKIGKFISVEPLVQNSDFVIPSTHVFQKIIEQGDSLTQGSLLPGNNDFTGYVPIQGSSEKGYLSINSELWPGGVTVLDINYNRTKSIWETSQSKAIDFSSVAGTINNCSGTVTPWNTIVSCEEAVSTADANNDSLNDFGWCVEINPTTKTVIDKLWALGNFEHENIVVHKNKRTVYQGIDTYPGYLYKFVADTAENLSSGNLYVYYGSKNGNGNWVKINNTSANDRNTTKAQSVSANATIFDGIEDVEIGPNGLIYFAVKGESKVFRFMDSDPIIGTTVSNMETYVGDTSYTIQHSNGTTVTSWGYGNDNLAFDGEGNLWVLQDGGDNHIWVVENGHTPTNPKVKLFGRTPIGSEPTGITFSPDYRFLFMSIQHPFSGNNSTLQVDAAGESIGFDKSISLVITRPCVADLDTSTHIACDSFTWIDGKTYTSSNDTATYTLPNNAGCDSIITLNLTINKSSTASDTLTACDSLTWINGKTYFGNNNTATDTLVNSKGCDSIVTLNLTINSVDSSVTKTGNILKATESGAKYQWLDCRDSFSIITGDTNQSFTTNTNGGFAVEITHNGCVDTSACIGVAGIGIIENDFGNELLLYPNPTNGHFSIDLGNPHETIQVIIRDLNSKVIQAKTYSDAQKVHLKIDEPNGVYLITIESGTQRAIIRLIKE